MTRVTRVSLSSFYGAMMGHGFVLTWHTSVSHCRRGSRGPAADPCMTRWWPTLVDSLWSRTVLHRSVKSVQPFAQLLQIFAKLVRRYGLKARYGTVNGTHDTSAWRACQLPELSSMYMCSWSEPSLGAQAASTQTQLAVAAGPLARHASVNCRELDCCRL